MRYHAPRRCLGTAAAGLALPLYARAQSQA
jgi:hypothetical protein